MHRKPLLDVSALDASYAAGFFDGEGCVAIYERAARHSGEGAVSPNFYVTVNMTNTHLGVLQHIRERIGGTVANFVRGKGKRRATYRWIASSKEASHILNILLPHVVVKREQILVALEFNRLVQERINRLHTGILGKPPLSSQEIAQRRALAAKIKALKNYGIRPS